MFDVKSLDHLAPVGLVLFIQLVSAPCFAQGPLVVNPTADPGQICQGEPSQLLAIASGGTGIYTYLWTSDPPGFSSDLQDPVVFPIVSTTYHVTVDDGDNIANGSVPVTVHSLPVPDAGDDQSIPYGTYTVLQGGVTGGSGSYSFSWTPADLLIDPTVQNSTTVKLYSTTAFSLIVTDLQTGCSNSDMVMVVILGGPLAVFPIATPSEVCSGETVELNAMALGGTGTYTYAWTSNPPGFTSDLPDPIANPTVTTIYNVNVDDGYNIAIGSVTVTVNSLPVPDAGDDMFIPNGVTIVLNGSATGGSGHYNFYWEPADKLIDPTVPFPETLPLFQTTLFWLAAADSQTGCVCSSADTVVISVSEDVLAVSPEALPDTICPGDTAWLFANATGGTGYFAHAWTSSPPGFTSYEPSPVAMPLETTIYSCEVYDGYNTVTGSVTVTVCLCDTLSYFGPGADTLYPYRTRGYCGYISGNNCDGDQVKANYFTEEVKTFEIEKVLLRFGKAVKASPEEVTIKVGIWSESGEDGSPGALIDFATIPLSRAVDDVSSGSLTTAVFTSPVPAPAGFFIGVMLPQSEGDTVALMTTMNDGSEAGSAWTLDSSEGWLSYSADPRFLIHVSNAIFPVARQTNVGLNESTGKPGELLIYPNPAHDLITIQADEQAIARKATVNIFNLQGKTVLCEVIRKEVTRMNIGNLKPGVYIIQARYNQALTTSKLVVY